MRTVTQQEQPEQPKNSAKTGWLHVRVDPAIRKQVNIVAAQTDKSVAAVVEEALEKHVGRAA